MGFLNTLVSWSRNFPARFAKAEDGQLAVWFAVLALPLLSLATFGIDYSYSTTVRKQMSGALDTAALAAVLDQTLTEAERSEFAKTVFKNNFHSKMKINARVDVKDSSANHVELVAHANVPTSISSALGMKNIAIEARSESVLTSEDVICVMTLNPHGSRSLKITRSAQFIAPNCSVQVNSDSTTAAVVDHGGSAKAKSFCVVGGTSGPFEPFVNTECSVIEDPYKDRSVNTLGDCVNYSQEFHEKFRSWQAESEGIELQPGVYCGGLDLFEKVINFAPGTYILRNGPLKVRQGSRVTADGVTFVFDGNNSNLEIQDGSNFFIRAPKTGDLAGIAFFESVKLGMGKTGAFSTGQNIINAGSNIEIVGTVYFPTQDIIVSGGSGYGSRAPSTSFIGYNVTMTDAAYVAVSTDYQRAGLPPSLPRSDEGARLIK